ncbi:MAG TPA: site-specific integrase [Phycisphaerae bacterium]|nr:site-specific integrase [Phycisphaerae bacterium]HNU44813.1 site-specific integrase [Phycisphaerae bacterium]
MASLYKRGEWFWIAYYANGQHVQKSLGTTNERVAKEKKKRIEYELSIGELQAASRLPIRMVLQRFCEHLQATRTFKSCKNDVSRLRVFFGPICEALEPGLPGGWSKTKTPKRLTDQYAHAHVKVAILEDVSPTMINQFISARIRDDGWSPKTANSMRQVLHRLFVYATKHLGFRARDRRYPNPADGVERQHEAAPEIRFLSLEQVEQQLEALTPNPLMHAMVAIYIYAGLRREETIWLTREDVNLETRLIHVRAKTIEGDFWQPKTKRNRVVPISSALLEILRTYEPPAGPIWFFPSPTGTRWHPDNFSQDLRAANAACGLSWSCLDFRHTFGSHLAQRGESLYKIATLMGNSPEICRRHYAALVPEAMHDSVEFTDRDRPPDQTARLLQEVLAQLHGNESADNGQPKLRIVRDEAG